MIQVKFFSSLREQVGRSEAELSAPTSISLRDVWRQSTSDCAMPTNTLCAINMEYAKLDELASDGDEVAFFPPVTGG
jgi:molybdopterin synthase sulfur carrier subunit